MNFLAHIYLSGDNDLITVGNFMADGIRGKKYTKYPKDIQVGILLHREIDTFTDAHEIVRKSKRRLHKRYNHYNGVIIDIFYDFFLAKNWHEYSSVSLQDFSNEVYDLLQKNIEILPLKSKQFLKYMIEYNLLFNYQFESGIEKVLKGMNHRTKGKSHMDLAIEDLKINQKEFEEDFRIFFVDLRHFVQKIIKN